MIGSDLQQTAPDCNRDRMGPIVGVQLADKIFDMEVDGSFRNRQSFRDLFVAIPVTNEPEYFQFPRCEIFLAEVLGEKSRDLHWYVPFAGMHRPDY